MKKLIALLLAVVMSFSLVACGGGEEPLKSTADLSDLLGGGSKTTAETTTATTESLTNDTSVTTTLDTTTAETPAAPDYSEHSLAAFLYGDWALTEKEVYDQAEMIPLTELTINDDGTCTADGQPMTWRFSEDTKENFLRIDIYSGDILNYCAALYGTTKTIGVWSANYQGGVDASWINVRNLIEITLENWQEYFEIKQCLGCYITTNAFGEPTEFQYDLTTFFALKEEFAETVVLCDVAIAYDADVSAKNIVFNANDLTFEIVGDYEGEVPELYRDASLFTRAATAKVGGAYVYQHRLKDGIVEANQVSIPNAVVVSGFNNDGISAKIMMDNAEDWQEINEGYIVKYTENVKITRIEGTLVLA